MIRIPFGQQVDLIPIQPSPTYKRGNEFVFVEDVVFELSDGRELSVKKGEYTDGSSVPAVVQFLFRLHVWDRATLASIVHDMLFERKNEFTLGFANKEFYRWSKAINPQSPYQNWVKYVGASIGGWFVWYKIIKL